MILYFIKNIRNHFDIEMISYIIINMDENSLSIIIESVLLNYFYENIYKYDNENNKIINNIFYENQIINVESKESMNCFTITLKNNKIFKIIVERVN